jgi:tRNA pseudouridine38-40 synthase
MKNIHVEISYDGSAYSGWQRLPDKKTVQGYLEKSLSRLLRQPLTIDGAGRTDTGVHAIRQSFTFQYDGVIPVENLEVYIGRKLEESVRIQSLKEMPKDFHARYSSKGKTYLYKINSNRSEEVFMRSYYCFQDSLNLEAMKKAADYLIGEHDFTSFSSNGDPKKRHDKIRIIESIEFSFEEDLTLIRFTGNGFLYRMIRLIMYHLIEVGKENRSPESTLGILNSHSRKKTNRLAPAAGLYLEKVRY